MNWEHPTKSRELFLFLKPTYITKPKFIYYLSFKHLLQSSLYSEMMDESTNLAFDNNMDIDDQDSSLASRSEEDTSSLEKYFRTNSLLLASFPWFTCLPMVDTKISDLLNEGEDQSYVRLL